MQDEKKISFGVKDNGFSAFMDKARGEFTKLRKEAQSIYTMFADEAKKDNLSFKDKTRYIQDQLKALKEQLRVEKELTQEKIKQNRARQTEAKADFSPGRAERFERLEEEEQQLRSRLGKLKGKSRVANEAGSITPDQPQGSFFKDLIKADLFRDLLGLARQIPNARSGVDLVGTAFSGLGAGAGALLGPLGAKLGKEAGGFLGDAITRSRYARNEYGQALYGFNALTGIDGDLPGSRRQVDINPSILRSGFWKRGGIERRAGLDSLNSRFSRMGTTDAETLQVMSGAAGAAGTGGGAEDAVALMLGLQRGYGIGQGVTQGALGSGRFGGGSGTTNVLKTLGIAIAEGLDRTRFADAVKGQVQLLERFAGASTTVDVNRANAVMFGLNRVGGEFSIGDNRSGGNIAALESGLSSPGSAFGQAQNYAVLRRMFPGANSWELRKKQQQGLMTPGFLEGVLGDVSGGTGSDEFKKFQLQGRFPGLSMAAVDTLWSGFKATGSVTDATRKQLGLGEVEGQAAKYTTTLQVQQAEIQNAFKESFGLGIKQVASAFTDEFKRAIVEVADFFSASFGASQGTPNKYNNNGNIVQQADATKKPALRGSLDSTKQLSSGQADSLRRTFGN